MRLAIVGLGFMGRVHLNAIAHVPGIELAGVVSRDPFRLTSDLSAGERFNFSDVPRYRKLSEALEDPAIDAVDLCLPTDLHESATIEALRAGKHVLVEKPMALDGAACERMIAEAGRQKRVLMVAHVLRFMPAYLTLESGIRGETVRAAWFRRRCARPGWAEWLNDDSRSGGGVFDLLIHDVDMALHLFGAPDAIAATGYSDAVTDCISARLFYPDGLTVEISGGWFHRDLPFSMEYGVLTDRATYDYHSESRPPRRYTGGTGEDLKMDDADAYANEIAYFGECARSGEMPVRCRPEESAAAVRLAAAMSGARARNGEKIAWN